MLRVVRRGGEAVHYLVEALQEGATVTQEVDWVRRHDHMQQHSGQHLITGELQLNHEPLISRSVWKSMWHYFISCIFVTDLETCRK